MSTNSKFDENIIEYMLKEMVEQLYEPKMI